MLQRRSCRVTSMAVLCFTVLLVFLTISAVDVQGDENSSCSEITCDGGKCLPHRLLCDGHFDCNDHSDEAGCVTTCDVNWFACGDGSCISKTRTCDGKTDCGDGSDEAVSVCTRNMTLEEDDNASGKRHTRNVSAADLHGDQIIEDCDGFSCDSGMCVSILWRCDEEPDCDDHSDERGCEEPCAEGMFRCENERCILDGYKCDGDNDCGDGSDEAVSLCTSSITSEEDLSTNQTAECLEFKCDSGRCVPVHWRCDGVADCDDRSDERGCSEQPCDENMFRCANGHCIFYSFRCDGDDDCGDGLDEAASLCGSENEKHTETSQGVSLGSAGLVFPLAIISKYHINRSP